MDSLESFPNKQFRSLGKQGSFQVKCKQFGREFATVEGKVGTCEVTVETTYLYGGENQTLKEENVESAGMNN